MNRPTRFFLLTPFLLESFGCASATQRRPNPTYPNAQSAAEVHVAVQSITPFEEIADALQPQFSITPEKALEEATPLALRESLASLRAFGANVGAGLPASTFGDTSTATTTTRVKSALSEQGVSSTEESALDERREENRTGRSSATLPVVTSRAIAARARSPCAAPGGEKRKAGFSARPSSVVWRLGVGASAHGVALQIDIFQRAVFELVDLERVALAGARRQGLGIEGVGGNHRRRKRGESGSESEAAEHGRAFLS